MSDDPRQFSSFDGLDNRRELMSLMIKLGGNLPEHQARARRARFLRGLMGGSTTGFKDAPVDVTPCSAVEGYLLFTAIVGCLGVKIDRAAAELERLVRAQ